MKYIIVKAQSLEELEELVNEKVGEGFIPTGGLLTETKRAVNNQDIVNSWKTTVWYIQSMLRSIPEVQVEEFKRFYVWDNHALHCTFRKDMDCTNGGNKSGKCTPTTCNMIIAYNKQKGD